MQLTAVLGFAAIAFTLVGIPGPDWAYVIAAGTRDRVVLPVITGLMTGYALITALVVVGAGALVAEVPFALTALTVAGARYLAYLGTTTLRSPGQVPDGPPAGALASSSRGYLLRGVGVSALNPKGLLLFVSILPQFAHPAVGWPLPAQLAALGGIYILIAATFYLGLGYAAGRVLGARPSFARLTAKVAGVAMILVAAGLLVERLVATRS